MPHKCRELRRRIWSRRSQITHFAGASNGDGLAPAGSAREAGPMTTVEQHRHKRIRTGLTAWDHELAYVGFTLYAPMYGDGEMYLLDMEGNVAHEWKLPYSPGLYGYLLDNGNLLYCGQTRTRPRFIAWRHFSGGSVMEVDWNGKVVWELQHDDHHHDARVLRNGNVLLMCLTELPEQHRHKVKGGIAGSEVGGRIYADYFVEMTTGGEEVWRWNSWEHLDFETEIITAQDFREEWTHGNTVCELPDGSLLASFRNISTVVRIDKASGDVTWRLGPPMISQQHDPRPASDHTITIFDNGVHRQDLPFPFSRVIEVDLNTSKIVWAYTDRSLENFFSAYCSGAQRLPNGNTFICETGSGRLFEVTKAGEVVWEFINPHVHNGPMPQGPNNWVFRAFRYGREEIERARAAANSGA